MLIIKSIKPLMSSIEEYSYFALLQKKNPETTLIYEFCFNSTWKRWEPDYIALVPSLHAPRFNITSTNDYNHTPRTLKERQESLIFLPNTEYYWKVYIPLTVITHFALMLLHKLLCCAFLRKSIKIFSFVSPLLWSLCAQNTLYLSFRTFLQLLAITSTTYGELVNIAACLLTLFLTLALSISAPIIYQRSVLPLLFDYLRPKSQSSYIYMGLSALRPFALGFCHAYLNSCESQLCCMLTVELLTFLLIVWCSKSFISKTVRLSILAKQIMRLLLHIVLIV